MMLPARKLPDLKREPLALHDRAMDNLRFIRETMERSQSFTAVSGAGGVLMGLVALSATLLAVRTETRGAWVAVWMGAAAVSLGIALAAMVVKARAAGGPILGGAGRKFAWNLAPPLLVGGLLTVAITQSGATTFLPGIWLLLYGAGVVTGGAFSVRVVPIMGLTFMAVGGVALFAPSAWGNLFMAGGFGLLHILFGAIIWRKHGG
ncbi:MAG TPA: hypothetical protein VLA36_02945 [Longimicrobiales bacterium]|nr:hypothetical protein [Longimicrobiales bacterium]